MRIVITPGEPDAEPFEVDTIPWDLVACEDRFKRNVADGLSTKMVLFIAFAAAKRERLIPDGATFEAWAPSVLNFEVPDTDPKAGQEDS